MAWRQDEMPPPKRFRPNSQPPPWEQPQSFGPPQLPSFGDPAPPPSYGPPMHQDFQGYNDFPPYGGPPALPSFSSYVDLTDGHPPGPPPMPPGSYGPPPGFDGHRGYEAPHPMGRPPRDFDHRGPPPGGGGNPMGQPPPQPSADRVESVVLHVGKSDNWPAFAVVSNQVFGPPLTHEFPFGRVSSDAVGFDGRIDPNAVFGYVKGSVPIATREIRVFELSPLSAQDQSGYKGFAAHYAKVKRSAVLDREYKMGLLLYFVSVQSLQTLKSSARAVVEQTLRLKIPPPNVKDKIRLWLVVVENRTTFEKYLTERKSKSSNGKSDLNDEKVLDEAFESSDEDGENGKEKNGDVGKEGSALLAALSVLYQNLDQLPPE